MTLLYPRERVEAVLRPLTLTPIHRIVFSHLLSQPSAVRLAPSRFCDGSSFAVFYAAGDFGTSFAEVVVRDRFVKRDQRIVPYDDIRIRGWVEFAVPQVNPLKLIDLRDSGCLALGAPTDTAHARNHSAARSLSRALYDQHGDVCGIWYRSRLTGGDCVAIFDRAVERLTPIRTGALEDHPALPTVLKSYRVSLAQ